MNYEDLKCYRSSEGIDGGFCLFLVESITSINDETQSKQGL